MRIRLAARVLRHPLFWMSLCLAAAVALLGTAFDFAGFVLALIAGWLGAHTVVRGLLAISRGAVSVGAHLAASVLAGALLFLAAEYGVEMRVLPASVVAASSFATITFAGWVWLALIGRVSAAVRAESDRRAARLIEARWERDAEGWALRAPAVVLRPSAYLAAVAVLAIAVSAVVVVVLVVFGDIVQRLSPPVLLFALGWVGGLPVLVVVRAVARARTVEVEVRISDERVVVRRGAERVTLLDERLDGIRTLRWTGRSAPTRAIVRPVAGTGVVLLFGLARRPKGAAATVPAPPAAVRRAGEAAGLRTRAGRPGELTLERPARAPG